MNYKTFRKGYLRYLRPHDKVSDEMEEIWKKHYILYKKQQRSNNFFEPYEENSVDWIDQYKEGFNQIFDIQSIEENHIGVLILPSFEPEKYLLIKKEMNHFEFIFNKLEVSIWKQLMSKADTPNIDTIIHSATIDTPFGDKFFNLLDISIKKAKTVEKGFITLDGVQYILTKRIDGKLTKVYKHSPDENSKTGKIITLIEDLIEWLQNQNDVGLNNLQEKIEKIGLL